LLSSLLQQPPPSSTLFPYTTLFRSCHVHCEQGNADPGEQFMRFFRRIAQRVREREMGQFDQSEQYCRDLDFRSRDERPAGQRGEDRKSTRLNSSHVKISYAVFCLKK